MGRRSKKETEGLVVLVVVVGFIWGATKFFDAVGFVAPAVTVVAALVVYALIKAGLRRQRRSYLKQKYNDETVVDSILSRTIWQGETSEQVLDTFGKPEGVDQKVLKTKKKEVWKYGHAGANRYALRITLENDIVHGWADKT